MGRTLTSLAKNFASYRGAVLFAALLTAFLMLQSGAGWGLETDLRSARDTLRSHPASGEIVIVEIDAASLAEIDTWPWPRSNHGHLVDRLNEAGAVTIAFDVDFSSHSTPGEDQAFARSLAESRALVLLPAFRQLAGSGRSQLIDSEPIAEFRDNAFLAAVNIRPDANDNGQVRRALLGVSTNGYPRPSLAAMISGTQGVSDTDFPIDFSIDPDTIPRFSFADIVAGRFDTRDLAGKTVIVGATAIEMGDRYAVPNHGVISGVVIQALAAETLLAGSIPAEQGPDIALMIALFGVFILIAQGNLSFRIAGACGVVVAVMLMPFIMEQWFGATAEIVPALAVLGAAGSTGLGALGLRKYRRTALLDKESGLSNRTALASESAYKAHITIVVGQIDGFAEIAALFSAADIADFFQVLRRRLTVATNGAIYRIGNGLIAWHCDDMDNEDLGGHLDAVAALLRSPIEIGSHRIDANLFFGVASGMGKDVSALAKGASLAAQQSAKSGQRWDRYVEGDDTEGKWKLALLGELDTAMENRDLWVALQPKLDIRSGKTFGAEALIRWDHPIRGVIHPDSFIPLVEQRGRMKDLTLYTVDIVLEALADWQSNGIDIGIAVNVSATLLDDQSFLAAVSERIAQSAIKPAGLTIEITESATMEDPDTAIAGMETLRAMGVRLSIDDYGTGQSTLTYLKRMPANEIKIDKSFVQGIEASTSDRTLVRSTIELAHELGFKVVAEGIEDARCLEILAEFGCDIAQGYFLGKPMTLSSFEALVLSRASEGLSQAA